MRITVSVPGMAKKPFRSGSVGPAALSGRGAAVDGSATESRCGSTGCATPGTWVRWTTSVAAVVAAPAATGAAGICANAGAGVASRCSSRSRRCCMPSSACRMEAISRRSACVSSASCCCAYAGVIASAPRHARLSTATRIASSPDEHSHHVPGAPACAPLASRCR
ncbi:hypothetical protein G6F57_020090 [Rhizopus arrhizus]|nr:hypothetical protein G6F57_020090 [Rhizopus arrhizus]